MPDPWSPQRPTPDGSVRVEPVVTVITPTIADRFEQLHEAAMSVRAQTLAGVVHEILLDAAGDGPAITRNAMLDAVQTPYVAFLDDDDLLDPEHLEILLAALELEGAAVAWSYHRQGPRTPRPKSERELWRTMRSGRNCIAVTVLARTDAIRAAGGFRAEDRYEDYELWMRLHALGYRFVLEPLETWTYRITPDGRTYA